MNKKFLSVAAIGLSLMAASCVFSCSKDDGGSEDPLEQIEDSSFSFVEPYHATACDEATIENYMKSVKGYHLDSRDMVMESTGTFQLIYVNNGTGAMLYMFGQNKLMSSGIYEDVKHYATVQKFLDGKYTFANEAQSVRSYYTSDKKQIIQLQKDSGKQGYLSVMYTIIKPD